MKYFIDPRTDPVPTYRGPIRRLALSEEELAGSLAACKQARLYDAEAWIANGGTIQLAHPPRRENRQRSTALGIAVAAGRFDLARLLICNGYQIDLEVRAPLNVALENRRWDLVDLLLHWGADPKQADVWRILGTYERAVLDRFWAAGVDLAADGAMASTLSTSTRNRPLYGFAKAYCDRDPRIQRALDVALGAAIGERNEEAVNLYLWAGANPRAPG